MVFKNVMIFIVISFCNISYAYQLDLSKVNPSQPVSLLDYFFRLPTSLFTNGMLGQYDLFENIRLDDSYTKNHISNIIYDESNAYFEIISVNYNYNFNIRFTSFKKADGTKIFGFSINYSEEGYNFSTNTFYILKNNSWIDISKQILPKIDFDIFFDKKSIPEKIYQKYDLHFLLPRYGTSINVELARLQVPDCDYDVKYWNKYGQYYNKRSYNSVILSWNKEKGVFTISDKVPVNK